MKPFVCIITALLLTAPAVAAEPSTAAAEDCDGLVEFVMCVVEDAGPLAKNVAGAGVAVACAVEEIVQGDDHCDIRDHIRWD